MPNEFVKRVSLDVPMELWKAIERAIPKKSNFKEFVIDALREKLDKEEKI